MNFFYSCLLLLLLIITGCDAPIRGDGNKIIATHYLDDFENIEISGNFEVQLIADTTTLLIVEADKNLHEYINFKTNNDLLTVNSEKIMVSQKNLQIKIHYSTLKNLTSAGTSAISNTYPIKSESLELNIPGAGSINLELEVEQLSINLPGAGVIKLIGYANHQQVELSGTGSYNGFNLISNETKIVLNGVGKAEVNAREKLDAQINGIGSISYMGDPAIISQEVHGLGKISKADDQIE